jgi:hypothetical protein
LPREAVNQRAMCDCAQTQQANGPDFDYNREAQTIPAGAAYVLSAAFLQDASDEDVASLVTKDAVTIIPALQPVKTHHRVLDQSMIPRIAGEIAMPTRIALEGEQAKATVRRKRDTPSTGLFHLSRRVRIVRNDRVRLVVRLGSGPRKPLAVRVHPLKIRSTLRIVNSKGAPSVHNSASQWIDSTAFCVTPYWIQVTLSADYPGHDHPREIVQTSRDPNGETK